MYKIGFILVALIIPVLNLFGQISEKGIPLEVPYLKGGESYKIELPQVNNEKMLLAEMDKFKTAKHLKPFQFATGFEVDYSPLNSGEWSVLYDGTQVWQLEIESKTAKSLNLIFYDFHLPLHTRLFLFNPDKSHISGAFTSFNNKESGKFAVLPVPGDRIIVQYEIPAGKKRTKDFTIKQVNHDYYGILKDKRRPLGEIAGSCNVDINCEAGEDWNDIKDAVCRMIVNGKEICTGTLINNTGEDQKPYIISAAHCYDFWDYAETTTYTFNYESPYCAPLDGDPVHTISGAVMRAQFDSLDFALVEMSLVPPPEFMPFYAGWDRRSSLPSNTVSIHHPQGDIKKISFDDDPPEYSDFNSDYTSNGFIKIARWDNGVTEAGSSGGPLFNPNQQIIGTLTGGVATCSNPVRDYFNRFELAWDYKNENSKQLKIWLDPAGTGIDNLKGKRFNIGKDYCGTFTNLKDHDEHKKIKITGTSDFAGYWGGSNNQGIKEFVDKFTLPGNETINGLSIGIADVHDASGGNSEIKIKVYNGIRLPESLIFEQKVPLKNLVDNAMNLIEFDEPVSPEQNFFVGFELSNTNSSDSLVLFQSLRSPEKENHFYFKKNEKWYNFQESNPNYNSMVSVFELLVCNIDGNPSDTPIVNSPSEILVYPNPSPSVFTLEAGAEFDFKTVRVYNILGKSVNARILNYKGRKVQIDLEGNVPGIYFVQVNLSGELISEKISYAPW